MKLNTIFISGPRHSGKSTLVEFMSMRTCPVPPHYLRLVPIDMESSPRLTNLGKLKSIPLASRQRVNYDAQHIFEFLPEVLKQIAATTNSPHVLIEADTDSNLRFAYPYDHRLFVMSAPDTLEEVFRSPAESASALREVMDDTAAFASEIYGMFDADNEEDEGVHYFSSLDRGGVAEERLEITPVQMRRFMGSALGAEIASRIQLQPEYHGLMDSDVVLVNSIAAGPSEVGHECLCRLRLLIERVSEGRKNHPVLFYGNPVEIINPLHRQFMEKIRLFFICK